MEGPLLTRPTCIGRAEFLLLFSFFSFVLSFFPLVAEYLIFSGVGLPLLLLSIVRIPSHFLFCMLDRSPVSVFFLPYRLFLIEVH